MADLSAMIAQLRDRNEPVPRPARLPTEAEVKAIESMTGILFPQDFRRYLLEASDVVFGVREPVTITRPNSPRHFPEVLADARKWGVPEDLIPLCHDNADYYCVAPSGEVVFWSHDGVSDERWPDIATWIEEVWIGEYESFDRVPPARIQASRGAGSGSGGRRGPWVSAVSTTAAYVGP